MVPIGMVLSITLTFILQEYIHVLSRPMVIDRADHTIWTSVYIDAAVGGVAPSSV